MVPMLSSAEVFIQILGIIVIGRFSINNKLQTMKTNPGRLADSKELCKRE